jgi:hypothetical protein
LAAIAKHEADAASHEPSSLVMRWHSTASFLAMLANNLRKAALVCKCGVGDEKLESVERRLPNILYTLILFQSARLEESL